jgi:hypothetical protein
LLGAVARLDAEASQGIAEDVARHARHGEWRIGYQLLADWLVAATVPPTVLVLEGAEHLEAGCPASLDMLGSATPGSTRPGARVVSSPAGSP